MKTFEEFDNDPYGEEIDDTKDYWKEKTYTEDQKTFMFEVEDALIEFTNAYRRLENLWMNDHNHNVDLNEYLTEKYPFHISFDELEIRGWLEDYREKLYKQ